MLTIVDCETVLALHEERHFSRAARRLGVTQPALTSRLQRIEQMLGTRLFERNRSGVHTTPAGVALVEGARKTLDAAQQAIRMARNAAEGFGETLVIGTTQVAVHAGLREILTAYRTSQPQARVLLKEGTTSRLEAQLESREVDVAFLHPPLHVPGVSELLVSRGTLLRLDLGCESRSNVVTYPRAEAPVLMGELARDAERKGEITQAEADSMLGAVLLSQAGYGACFVEGAFAEETVGKATCAEAPSVGRLDTSLAWRSLDRRTVVRAFVDLVRQMAE